MPAHITWLLLGAAILIAALPGGESSHNCPKSKACCKDSESCCGDWCCPKARHTCVGVTCIPTQTLMTHMAIGQAAGRRAGRPMLFPPFANGQGFPQMERRIPSDLPKVNKKHKVELITKMNLTGPISGPCNNYEIEKVNEGHYLHVYKDPLGIPTIGVGFNLKKSGARKKITDVGANYDLVLAGKQDLTEAQVGSTSGVRVWGREVCVRTGVTLHQQVEVIASTCDRILYV